MHWISLKPKEAPLRSQWQADEIVVTRGGQPIDRLRADEIERVTLVHADSGDSPGDVRAAILELADHAVLLGAESGIAGRLLFERQAYWSQRNCIYWVNERFVSWPRAAGAARWLFAPQVPAHRHLSPAALGLLLDRSNPSGPHTWGQRKQLRVERRRPFPGRVTVATQAHGSVLTPG